MIEPGPQDVLLVIDVQNGFVPGGALPVTGGDEVVPLINRLAGRFQHVVLTQDWHPPGHVPFASSQVHAYAGGVSSRWSMVTAESKPRSSARRR